MSNFIDYQSTRRGKLYVSHRVKQTTKHDTTWWCTCDCGTSLPLTQVQLKAGRTDCGCVVPISKGGKFSQSRQELKMHEAVEEFLYRYRRKYAEMSADQRHEPMPECRYCQIPTPVSDGQDRLSAYLRQMPPAYAGSKAEVDAGIESSPDTDKVTYFFDMNYPHKRRGPS